MIFAFGDLELDVGLYELRRRGQAVKLAPKAFDLLLHLIEHRDRVVSKTELLECLWPGEHVGEAVLPSNVTAIRKALQGGRSREHFIQTVHGRGYRFVAPVEQRAEDLPADPEPRLFVGREDVMQALCEDLDSSLAGHGRVAMLVGEPGIGKTRTAEELAAVAGRRGALFAQGRCYEDEGVPAFWPFVQILRSVVADLPHDRLLEQAGAGAPEIAALLPELRQRLPELPETDAVAGSAQARFRLFDSVSRFLCNTARGRALVVSVDDLHWADEPTLLLFHHLAREIRDARVLMLGSYRDMELRRQHPLASLLGELSRQPHLRRVRLRGLAERDVSRVIEASTDAPCSEALARAVFDMTEGNPFFVSETVQLLGAEGRLATPALPETQGASTRPTPIHVNLPQGVREVIGRRLDRLSEACNRVLTLAAVIGREFPVAVLQETAELSRESLLDLLEESVEARIVDDSLPGDGGTRPLPLGHFTFRHALIRKALYEELSAPRRVRLHRRVAEALERRYGADARAHLPELAHHFFQAAPGGDIDKAIAYGVSAALQAQELLAFEESVSHLERVLEVEQLALPTDDRRRGELTLQLALALWQAGSYPRARATFQRVIDLARSLGDGDLLARAALGMGRWPRFRHDEAPGGIADEHRALLEEALARVGEDQTALRSRLLSHLAEQNAMSARESYSQLAVALARESRDPDALFDALLARQIALLGPDDVRRRLELADELVELAKQKGSREQIFIARESRMRSLLALGEIAGMDREIEACHLLAEQLRLPIYRHSVSRFRLARAIGDGRFEDARQLLGLVRELGPLADDGGAELLFHVMGGWLQLLRGDLSPLRELVGSLREQINTVSALPDAFTAYLQAGLGEREEARQSFETAAKDGFDRIPRDEDWLLTLALAAEACAYLEDRPRARALYALLLPFADQLVAHQHLRAYTGPVHYPLAQLARSLGEPEKERVHLEEALEKSRRIGARPQIALASFELGRLLLTDASIAPQERQRAHALIRESEALAREIGLDRLAEGAGSLLD